MELIKLTDRSYYIKNATNIGVYKINEKDVYLIDSGNDKDAGRRILRVLDENNLSVAGVINTHSHADHIGGNSYLQNNTDAKIYSSDAERCFVHNTLFEPSFLYGAYPFGELKNKFLMAKESKASTNFDLIDLEVLTLSGHSINMIGIKTQDDVYYLGDSLVSENTINKYHLFYIYNVDDYLKTLDYLESLNGKYYVCSHCEVTDDIKGLIKLNRDKIEEICKLIINLLSEKLKLEDLIKKIFDHYNLELNLNQYVLVGSTIKAYLSYLKDKNLINYVFENNYMFWYKQ